MEGLVPSILPMHHVAAEKSKDPAYHNDPTVGSHAEIFNSSTITREMRMHSSLLGFDGVTLELRASDPIERVELPIPCVDLSPAHSRKSVCIHLCPHGLGAICKAVRE